VPFGLPCRFSDYRILITSSDRRRRSGKGKENARGVECTPLHRTLRGSPFTSRRIADSESSTIRSDCFLPWTLTARIYLLISSLSLFPSFVSVPAIVDLLRLNLSEIPRRTADRVSTLYSRLRNYE